jgi:hypothetical protein
MQYRRSMSVTAGSKVTVSLQVSKDLDLGRSNPGDPSSVTLGG